jgi:hypothetical protein
MDLSSILQNKKNRLNLIILLVMVVAIPIILKLVSETQIFKPKAAGAAVDILVPPANSIIRNGVQKLKVNDQGKALVGLKLTSPFGPGEPSNGQTNNNPTPSPSASNQSTNPSPTAGSNVCSPACTNGFQCINNICVSPGASPSPSPSSSGTVVEGGKRVFITSQNYNGNLGGLSGADTKCQTAASSASLPGTYKAWLSDSQTSAASRLSHSTTPYVLVDGTLVANSWTDLVDGTIQHNINKTESGANPSTDGGGYEGSFAHVWTLTHFDGSKIDAGAPTLITTCENWTAATAERSYLGTVADKSTFDSQIHSQEVIDHAWTESALLPCNIAFPLYCFQQ